MAFLNVFTMRHNWISPGCISTMGRSRPFTTKLTPALPGVPPPRSRLGMVPSWLSTRTGCERVFQDLLSFSVYPAKRPASRCHHRTCLR